MLSGPHIAPRGTARQLVVILHGWGADGHNLIDLGEAFSRLLPDAYFIAPNGPAVCDVNPYGFQWFSLNDRRPDVMLSGVRAASAELDAFIDAKQAELKLDDAHTALVGFSQGTMTALHTGLRRSGLAGIVGFSGALIGPEVLGGEIKHRPPVCLIHGEMDDVVPYAATVQAEAALSGLDINVETHTRPQLGHSIDLEGLEIAGRFLQKVLA